jgi:hypothetical protein
MCDELNQSERWLMGELLKLSNEVLGFVMRTVAAEVQRGAPPRAGEEAQLGARLVELGKVVAARAVENRAERS